MAGRAPHRNASGVHGPGFGMGCCLLCAHGEGVEIKQLGDEGGGCMLSERVVVMHGMIWFWFGCCSQGICPGGQGSPCEGC